LRSFYDSLESSKVASVQSTIISEKKSAGVTAAISNDDYYPDVSDQDKRAVNVIKRKLYGFLKTYDTENMPKHIEITAKKAFFPSTRGSHSSFC